MPNNLDPRDATGVKLTMRAATAETPPGRYEARFTGLEHDPRGDYGPFYTFVFEGDGVTHKGFATVGPYGPTPDNKLGRWLMSLAGRRLAPGEEFDPGDYLGQRYTLTVAASTKDPGKTVLESFTPAA